MIEPRRTRREFLSQAGCLGLAASSLGSLAGVSAGAEAALPFPRGKAEACIFIWLGGGACHIDTWDPKRKGDGRKKPGSYYDSIATAIPGAAVCQHLSRRRRCSIALCSCARCTMT